MIFKMRQGEFYTFFWLDQIQTSATFNFPNCFHRVSFTSSSGTAVLLDVDVTRILISPFGSNNYYLRSGKKKINPLKCTCSILILFLTSVAEKKRVTMCFGRGGTYVGCIPPDEKAISSPFSRPFNDTHTFYLWVKPHYLATYSTTASTILDIVVAAIRIVCFAL